MNAKARRTAMLLGLAMGATAALTAIGMPNTADDGAARPALEQLFPRRLGDWRVEERFDAFVRAPDARGRFYGIYDQVLERSYANAAGDRLMLSVAYGREQSGALQMHRPEVCYPAGGFDVEAVHATTLALAERVIPATRLHAKKGAHSEPITYWTVLGDSVVANEGQFRWRRLSFKPRRQSSDGMLVRISSIDADAQHAYLLHSRFAAQLAAAIDPALRAHVIGAPSAR